jgi:hypothetical protein
MKNILLITSFALIILFPNLLNAQNYNDALLLSEPGLYNNARALSLGNSYIAAVNDYSSILFNPAGLGLMKNSQISASIHLGSFSNTSDFFNNTTDVTKTRDNFDELGIVFPIPTARGSWVIAMGYNRVKDFNKVIKFDGFNNGNNSMIQFLTGEYNYDQVPITNDVGVSYEIDDINNNYIKDTTRINGMLNQSGQYVNQGSINNYSLGTSFEAAKDLFVGGTFTILSGTVKRDRELWEDDTLNIYGSNLLLDPFDPITSDFQSFYFNDIIDWDLSGWTAKIGMIYNWKNRFRFGATVKFPNYFSIKETYYIKVSSFFAGDNGYDSNTEDKVKYDIKTPFEFSFGGAFNLPQALITADITLIDYTQMEFTGGFDYDFRAQRNKDIEDLFTTVVNYSIGAEFAIPQSPFKLRVGGMYKPSPYSGDPSEFDKKFITAGAGFDLGDRVAINLGYAHGWWKDFTDNYDSNVSRIHQDITYDHFILSFSTSL